MFAWLVNPYSPEWMPAINGEMTPPDITTKINEILQPGSVLGASNSAKAACALALYQIAIYHWDTSLVLPIMIRNVRSMAGMDGIQTWLETLVK